MTLDYIERVIAFLRQYGELWRQEDGRLYLGVAELPWWEARAGELRATGAAIRILPLEPVLSQTGF